MKILYINKFHAPIVTRAGDVMNINFKDQRGLEHTLPIFDTKGGTFTESVIFEHEAYGYQELVAACIGDDYALYSKFGDIGLPPGELRENGIVGRGNISAKIIEDSVSPDNVRITTFELRYPRFVHSEFMTHRVFSRNAASSRAIPVAKMRAQVWNDPASPIHWGANQRGMQASAELTGLKLWAGKKLWSAAGKAACGFSWLLEKLGAHKQWANRILEPWQFITVVMTTTELDNFFELRHHEDAQPEIHELAVVMRHAYLLNEPVKRGTDRRRVENWHLPYVTAYERDSYPLADLRKMSTARCARTSYLTHDKANPEHKADVFLHDRLVASRPIHASPTEHQAHPSWKHDKFFGNLRGWVQYRKYIEEEMAKPKAPEALAA